MFRMARAVRIFCGTCKSKPLGGYNRWPSCSVFAGYFIGLATTIVVMNVFEAAQPALLYIVPAVIGALALHSAATGNFKEARALP